jgi:phosphohistidine phosphatase SixA
MAAPTKNSLGTVQLLQSEYLVPGSNPEQLFDLLNDQSAGSLLLVGHEPHLSATIAQLISGEETARIEMKKAGCACVEVAKPVERGRGVLKWLVTAEQMK